MKPTTILILLLLAFAFPQRGQAQIPVQNIFEALAKSEYSQGRVTVHQSTEIRALVGRRVMVATPQSPTITTTDRGMGFSKVQGYRVQIYSGNRPNSKSIAHNRERQLNEQNPELNTYVLFKAPFWRVHVGNFLSRSEAQETLRDLKALYPQFAREMIIVRDQVFVAN